MADAFDRVPPHDLEAESAVLSAMLVDPIAADKAVGMLTADKMYSESHRWIFDAISGLLSSGNSVDAVQVATWLRDNGRLAQVGGMAYLSEVMNAAPAVANIEAYATIVAQKWQLRQLILVAQRIVAEGYAPVADPIEFIDRAEQMVYEVGRSSSKRPKLHPMKDVVRAKFTEWGEYWKKVERGEIKPGQVTGMTTGLRAVDEVTGGLQDSTLTIVASRPGMGKAQPLDAKISTPSGWTTMGALSVGDRVVGSDGKPCTVTGVFDRGEREVFRVVLDDGSSTECCDDHLWMTHTRNERRYGAGPSVRTLREIRATLTRGADGGRNHSIPYVRPVHFDGVEALPVDPYGLGLWIGDGCANGNVILTNPENEIVERFSASLPESDTISFDGMTSRVRRKQRNNNSSCMKESLTSLGLSGCRSETKFIPKQYLVADVTSRTKLLQGLCDTDGYVTDPGGKSIEYTTVSTALSADITELARGLGGYVTRTEKNTYYTKEGVRHQCQPAYRMNLAFPGGDIVPVSTQKHLKKWGRSPHRTSCRYITTVKPSGYKPCRCITVDATDRQYVTDDYIVTHNSSLVYGMAEGIATTCLQDGSQPYGAALFSLEMPEGELAERAICGRAEVDSRKAKTAMFDRGDWSKLTSATVALSKTGQLLIDDTANLTLTQIRAMAREASAELARKGKSLKLVAVDYLQLVETYGQNREQAVAAVSRGLKQMAKEMKIPVVALAQLNREVEKRSDKRPMLMDLRESGGLEADADVVIFIYRDEYYNTESEENGVAELLIAKHRGGPTGTVKVGFDGWLTRFRNLPEEQQYYGQETQ
jgi:replicative DNA helicase